MITDLKENEKKQELWVEMIKKYDMHYLWDEEIPNWDENMNQEKPSVIFFKSQNSQPKHGCVLIIAGGAYIYKSVNEGTNIAKRINDSGLDAAILDYRLAKYDRNVILSDAKRAVRYLRYNSSKFGFDEDKIAVMGFSAGGNLATLCALKADDGNINSNDPIERVSSRPNAVILCYPAVNIVDEYQKQDEFSLISYFDVVIDKEKDFFPPTFIWHSMSDKLINFRASIELGKKLKSMNVPVEMHFFPYGGHGQGLANTTKGEVNKGDNKLTSCWSELCIRWLNFYGF